MCSSKYDRAYDGLVQRVGGSAAIVERQETRFGRVEPMVAAVGAAVGAG
jgi:hypothetical protein